MLLRSFMHAWGSPLVFLVYLVPGTSAWIIHENHWQWNHFPWTSSHNPITKVSPFEATQDKILAFLARLPFSQVS
jgi:hypothetical protein